jgi:uncharacterized protein
MATPGVGLVFTTELIPLLREAGGLISVVEIEPQTLWRRCSSTERIRLDRPAVESVLELPQRKIVHSIGLPVGGSIACDPLEIRLLAQSIDLLRPEWASEHLSFNRVPTAFGSTFAGFLLPPQQSPSGVAVAASNMRQLQQMVEAPLAFETGVNYLLPTGGEMSDGDFFSSVAQAADCGIVLDLHNLWVNECNGRQGVKEVIARLPRERVWEIHVAGGSTLDGYRLDSHDGLVPAEVMNELEASIHSFPNLRAVMFEILPQHVLRIGLDAIEQQLEVLFSLCAKCSIAGDPPVMSKSNPPQIEIADFAAVAHWELKLGTEFLGKTVGEQKPSDADVGVYRKLMFDARSGAIAQCLRYTLSVLFLSAGAKVTEQLMSDYIHGTEAQPFVEDEALQFTDFIRTRHQKIPYLQEVLNFESGVLESARGDAEVSVEGSHDLEAVFEALERGVLPELPSNQLAFDCSRTLATRR